jgi:hypothetical protein
MFVTVISYVLLKKICLLLIFFLNNVRGYFSTQMNTDVWIVYEHRKVNGDLVWEIP